MSKYTNLAAMGWKLGVHKAPTGYEHPWLVVFADRTDGATSRADARQWWSYRHRDGRAPDGER